MTEKAVLRIFQNEEALLSGHFLLSSSLHSGRYMQCALLLQKPWIARKLCAALAEKFKDNPISAVIGPSMGGIIVSYEVARALKVRSLFAERTEGVFTLRRGFSLAKGEQVLVVEDVITTGKSTLEVIDLVKKSGAVVAGIGSIVDRTQGASLFGEPFHSLLKIDIKTYKPEDCPICKEGKIPVVKPGSRGLKS